MAREVHQRRRQRLRDRKFTTLKQLKLKWNMVRSGVRLALVAAVSVVAVATAGAAEVSLPKAVVGLDWGFKGARLVRVEPVTLARVDDSAVPLDRHQANFRFSPDGSRVVLGRDRRASVRIVDVRRMRRLGDVDLGRGSVELTRWPSPRRVVVVLAVDGDVQVASVDPVALRRLQTRTIPGTTVRAHADADADVVLLLGPTNDIGPARIAVVGATGVRLVTLERIRAGLRRSGQSAPPLYDARTPALAVDPAGRRAYVIGEGEPVATVDLATLTVEYRALPTPRGEVDAVTTSSNGPYRRAVWVGGGRIALAGYDETVARGANGTLNNEAKPIGLRILDTQTWTGPVIDDRAATVVTAGGLLFSLIGNPFQPSAFRGYEPSGRRRFSIEKERPISVMRMTGGLVYLWCQGQRIVIVDASSGRILNRTRTRVLVLG